MTGKGSMDIFFLQVNELKKRCRELYIYGAGLYGQNIYKILKKNNISVDGFIVSEIGESESLFDIPIYSIRNISLDNVGIILGLNRHNTVDVLKLLRQLNFDESKMLIGSEYIDRGAVRGGYDEIPTIEITTRIGCRINCRYCPQSALLSKYFCGKNDREIIMSFDVFKECMKNVPQEAVILFSGMTEPLHNSYCIDMIDYALNKGHKVDLYSTFSEVSMDDVKTISNLPLEFVGLHVADKRKYANIINDEEYYQKIEFLINAKKKDGTPFVSVCNSQTEPDDRVVDLCEGKYEILTTMLDRAGNLQDESLYSKKTLHGKISCSLCGEQLNHNVLLPDGTLLLCCMDYGMEHILGNLRYQKYEQIMLGKAMQQIKAGLSGDEKVNILCRKCSCANLVEDV